MTNMRNAHELKRQDTVLVAKTPTVNNLKATRTCRMANHARNGEEGEGNHNQLPLDSSLLRQECRILQPDPSRMLVRDGNETEKVKARGARMKSKRKPNFSKEPSSSNVKESWSGVRYKCVLVTRPEEEMHRRKEDWSKR